MRPKNIVRVALLLVVMTVGALVVGGAGAARPAGPPGQATLHVFMGFDGLSVVSGTGGFACGLGQVDWLNCFKTYRFGTTVTLTESDTCAYFENVTDGTNNSSPYTFRMTKDTYVKPHQGC
jgi:hypothetical protein